MQLLVSQRSFSLSSKAPSNSFPTIQPQPFYTHTAVALHPQRDGALKPCFNHKLFQAVAPCTIFAIVSCQFQIDRGTPPSPQQLLLLHPKPRFSGNLFEKVTFRNGRIIVHKMNKAKDTVTLAHGVLGRCNHSILLNHSNFCCNSGLKPEDALVFALPCSILAAHVSELKSPASRQLFATITSVV